MTYVKILTRYKNKLSGSKKTISQTSIRMYHNRLSEQMAPLIGQSDLDIIKFSDDIPEIVGIYRTSHDMWRKNIRDHVRIIRSLK